MYTNEKHAEKEIMHTLPFTIVSEHILGKKTYLRI